VHNFGEISFSDHVWIDDGRLFNEPLSVTLNTDGKVKFQIGYLTNLRETNMTVLESGQLYYT